MEVSNAFALIQLLVDHQEKYSRALRQELLEGAYEITAACLQTLEEAAEPALEEDAHREMAIAARMIEQDLLSGDLTEGFLLAHDCFNKALVASRKCHPEQRA